MCAAYATAVLSYRDGSGVLFLRTALSIQPSPCKCVDVLRRVGILEDDGMPGTICKFQRQLRTLGEVKQCRDKGKLSSDREVSRWCFNDRQGIRNITEGGMVVGTQGTGTREMFHCGHTWAS